MVYVNVVPHDHICSLVKFISFSKLIRTVKLFNCNVSHNWGDYSICYAQSMDFEQSMDYPLQSCNRYLAQKSMGYAVVTQSMDHWWCL